VGSKNKLKRFKENETLYNVVQPTREELLSGSFELRGKWAEEFFKNSNPLVLELGCGRGEYSVNLARKYPDKNFLGIDIKGARFWYGAKTAIEESLPNVGFVRAQIELLDLMLSANEVDEIWITFPDPQIKYQRTKHRMTNPDFLAKYKKILRPDGRVHLKTDCEFMHGYTLGILEVLGVDIEHAQHDIYKCQYTPKDLVDIQTYYEKQFLEEGKKITYIRFKF